MATEGVGVDSLPSPHHPKSEHKKSTAVSLSKPVEVGCCVCWGVAVGAAVRLGIGATGSPSGQLPRNSQIESYFGGSGNVGNVVGTIVEATGCAVGALVDSGSITHKPM